MMQRPIALLCLAWLTVSVSLAQDWPQWRGPARDGKATGFVEPAAWPATLTQQWRVTVGTGDATPALVGDKLYVAARQGDEEVTLCLNAADGSQVWVDKVATPAVTGAASRHPGPRSSPAVAAGKVVTLGVTGVVSCFDAATGALSWRKDPYPNVFPRFYTSSSPLIADGLVVAQLGGAGNGALLAYDLATGDEKWRWTAEGPDYASPVLMTVGDARTVVALTEKSVVGVQLSDGKLLWQVGPFVPQGRAYNSASPIINGPNVIYTGAGRGTFCVKVDRVGDGLGATPVWSNTNIACQFSTPVLRDGFLYGLSTSGNLFCLNAQTGETAWIDPAMTDRGTFCALVDAGPVLVALPSGGELIVFRPISTAHTPVARIKVAETATYAFPVVAGKVIYVKDQESLTAYQVP